MSQQPLITKLLLILAMVFLYLPMVLGNPDRVITDAEARQSLIRGAIELCRQGTATTDRVLDANIPLDPDKTKNPDYPTTDTVDFYIGYYGGNSDRC